MPIDHVTFQDAFNIAVSVAAAAGGWVIRSLYDSLRDMRAADTELADRVQRIELLVAGEYVRRDELDKKLDALFAKLDRIEEKLERKADRC